MAGEILKFGAMIVDALIKYEHPVQVYIPPNGELRGGAWVVIDPTINAKVMEMYCDKESRGGILEPPGICEVKFRAADQVSKMHQLDDTLKALDEELESATSEEEKANVAQLIKDRETQLLPLYLQVAHEFADLHDRSGRMKAKGVVRDVLNFKTSREYLYWRIKRRIAEQGLREQLTKAPGNMSHEEATAAIVELMNGAYDDDRAFLDKLDSDGSAVHKSLGDLKTKGVAASIEGLLAGLTAEQKASVLSGLN